MVRLAHTLITSSVLLALACQADDDGDDWQPTPGDDGGDGGDDGGNGDDGGGGGDDDGGSGDDGGDNDDGGSTGDDGGGGDDGGSTGGDDGGGDDGGSTGDDGGATGDDGGGGGGCELPDPGLDQEAAIGNLAPHYTALDQYGEPFELCELAGRPILVDISTMWCTACKKMAACLAGVGDDSCVLNEFGTPGVLDALKRGIEDGTFTWVTVITQNEGNGPPTQADAVAWHEAYPHDGVPVVADVDQTFAAHLSDIPWGYPTFVLIDPEFRYQNLDDPSGTPSLHELVDVYLD